MCMARTSPKKAIKRGHFLLEWRKFRSLSQEKVSERLAALSEQRPQIPGVERIGITRGNLSRIERGEVPYSQPLLELLAEIYQTDAASLIMRNPKDPLAIWSIWDQISPQERVHATDVLLTFVQRRTGTQG